MPRRLAKSTVAQEQDDESDINMSENENESQYSSESD